jgi:hypothetical protein
MLKARIIFSEHDELQGKEGVMLKKSQNEEGEFVWESNVPDPDNESLTLKFKESQIRFLTDMSQKERALHYIGGFYTDVVFTDDVKEDIISEIEAIPDVTDAISLLKEVEYALNTIPNQRNVGKGGESSYDIASKVGRFLREHKEIFGEN